MPVGYHLIEYEGKLASFIIPLLLLTSISGLSLLGLWIFEYSETSKDLIQGTKKSNNYSKYKNNYLIPGAVLTSISTLVTVITMIHLHSEALNKINQ